MAQGCASLGMCGMGAVSRLCMNRYNVRECVHSIKNAIEDFSKDCPETRYGALPARNDSNVCVSGLIYHLFFDLESQPSITVVFIAFAMDAGRVLHYPMIAFH